MLIPKSLEHQVLPIPFYSLLLCGVWCPENVESWFKHIYSIFTATIIIVNIVTISEILVHFVITIWKTEFEMDTFFILESLIAGAYKGLHILVNRKLIKKLLLEGFQDTWRLPRNQCEKNILLNVSKRTWRIQIIYAISAFVGVGIKNLEPMLRNSNTVTELPAKGRFPYDTNKSLYFWLSYIQQSCAGTSVILMHIGADTILSGLMIQLCLQLQLLSHRLCNFFQFLESLNTRLYKPTLNAKVEDLLMNQYICDHQFIYSYAEMLSDFFFGWLFCILIVVMPNICINVYLISVSEIKMDASFISQIGLFSISLFQIYLPCWYGNEIMFHSIQIRDALYKMNWINLEPYKRKTLVIIMIRASKPIEIFAIYIFKIYIQTFLSIIKSSFSVVSVLRQM